MRSTTFMASMLALLTLTAAGCRSDNTGVDPTDPTTTTLTGTVTNAGGSPVPGATLYVAASGSALTAIGDNATLVSASCPGGASVTCDNPPEAACAQSCSCADGSYALDVSGCGGVIDEISFCVDGECATASVTCSAETCTVNVVSNFEGPSFQSVAKIGDRFLIIGSGGRILSTTDFTSLAAVSSGTTKKLNSISPLGEALLVFGDDGTILRSDDDGATFAAGGVATAKDFNESDSVSDLVVFVAADGGSVFKTTDGGDHWSEITGVASAAVDFQAVDFLDDQIGWAVGTGGSIRKTEDGGATWTAQTSGTTLTLNDIDAAKTGEAWIAGEGGILLYTVDGGANWQTRNSGTTADLRAIGIAQPFSEGAFLPFGFAAGEGFLGKTTDFDATWANLTPSGDLSGDYNAFTSFGADLNNLILVGDDNLIVKGNATDGFVRIEP